MAAQIALVFCSVSPRTTAPIPEPASHRSPLPPPLSPPSVPELLCWRSGRYHGQERSIPEPRGAGGGCHARGRGFCRRLAPPSSSQRFKTAEDIWRGGAGELGGRRTSGSISSSRWSNDKRSGRRLPSSSGPSIPHTHLWRLQEGGPPLFAWMARV